MTYNDPEMLKPDAFTPLMAAKTRGGKHLGTPRIFIEVTQEAPDGSGKYIYVRKELSLDLWLSVAAGSVANMMIRDCLAELSQHEPKFGPERFSSP